MKLPLVSRRAFDLLLDERDRLRAANDSLTDNLVRLQRASHGLREAPRVPKPKVDLTVPPEISELYAGFSTQAVKDEIERQAKEMRAGGTPWPEIRRVLEAELLEPSDAS